MRQCTYRASGFDPEAPYSLDDPPFCQEINQIALDNAIEALAGTSILDRYLAHGIPYEMEEDKVVIACPSWLEFGLKYEPVMNGDQTGKVHKVSRAKVVVPSCRSKVVGPVLTQGRSNSSRPSWPIIIGKPPG